MSFLYRSLIGLAVFFSILRALYAAAIIILDRGDDEPALGRHRALQQGGRKEAARRALWTEEAYAAFNDFMSITKRYRTSLFSRRV